MRGGHHQHKLKFYLYSVYAWGSAFLITGITILLDRLPNVSESIVKPNIDLDQCWFSRKYFFHFLRLCCLFAVGLKNCISILHT